MALFRCGRVGDGDDPIRHRSPFLAPDTIEIGFPGTRREPPTDTIDLVHGNCAVGRHPFDDLHGVAPAEIAGKMHRPRTAVGVDAATAVIKSGVTRLHCHRVFPPRAIFLALLRSYAPASGGIKGAQRRSGRSVLLLVRLWL